MTLLFHLAVTKFGCGFQDALYDVPVATLMLLLYQEAWSNDGKIMSLEDRAAADMLKKKLKERDNG